MRLTERFRLALRILRQRRGNLMAHTLREMGNGCDIEIKELVHVFSTQGHSGSSAAITSGVLAKLLRYEPIGPLTGEPDEWAEVADGIFQNKRCGRVFKQADRFGGQAYDTDGIVWEDEDGSRFTNGKSAVPVMFPYTPSTEYRAAPATEGA
jgi:hypothetical protein